MGDGLIVLLGLAGAAFLLAGVGVSAYKRIRNASRPGGGAGDILSRLGEELERRGEGEAPPRKEAPGPGKKE